MVGKKLGTIAFMVDERISREKAQILMRTVNALRQHVTLIPLRSDLTEAAVLEQLESQQIQLVLVPWYRYLAWTRVEAFYGLTRTSGPTFAGYFADQVAPGELPLPSEHLRAILLDLVHLSTHDSLTLLLSLIQPEKRSGIRPLIDRGTTVFTESWAGAQPLGSKLDGILSLPEIAGSDWVKRSTAIRGAVSALWSLVYEEGPGKGEFAQTIGAKSPKGYFQMAADPRSLMFRLCYSMSGWAPKDVMAQFWPDGKRPFAASQLLLRFCDFVRVHIIAESPDLEVIAGFYPSAPSEKLPSSARSLWIEPLAPQLIEEVPFAAPGPANPLLKPFPGVVVAATRAAAGTGLEDPAAKDRFIFNAAVKLRELKRALEEREEQIRELKSGGVGTAPPLPLPDPESLLEAFQERFFEARLQIRQLELSIVDAERTGATPQQLESIRQKIAALTQRERSWLSKLTGTVQLYRESKRK
jgi:hypothetical protein